MYIEEIELITAGINNTQEIEVLYTLIGKNDGVEVMRRREGRVWKPTEKALMDSDVLSGSLAQVKTLANTFWSAEVISAYQATEAQKRINQGV